MFKSNIKILSPINFTTLLKKSTPQSRVIPIDCTWYMPNVKKLGFDTFKASRIPNAIFVDIDKIKDDKSPYPHMLPNTTQFQSQVSRLGIRNSDHVVMYDQIGNFSAPRAAWMFDVFKHKNIYLLDNFLSYKNQKLPIDTTPVTKPSLYEPSDYQNEGIDLDKVVSFEDIYTIVTDPSKSSQYHILDARAEGRFEGTAPEPRPGLPSGHAPGTSNVPATSLLDPETKTFLPKEQLADLFSSKNVDDSKPIITLCGTGVTACIVKSALEIAGFGSKGLKVYDGSWTEYAQRADSKNILGK